MATARPQLITFAASHFCEKARWALDWHGISYEEVGWPPGLHQVLAKRHGLTTPQIAVMREVSDATKLPVSQIAARTCLSHATVSGILDRLERGGYIERVRDHADRRCVNVQLTAAGRREMDRTPPLLKQGFVTAFAGLPEWEQMALLSALERVAEMMGRAE